MTPKRQIAVWTAILALTLGSGFAAANNQNGCYKFADAVINWYNGAKADYFNVFEEEARTDADAWDPYTDVVLNPVAAAGTTDHINAYAGRYGNNGWLALTELSSVSGCTIRSARIRLNQSYLDSYPRSARETLACNGIGKSLGLKNEPSFPGCMDGTLNNPFPSTHDRDTINAIY